MKKRCSLIAAVVVMGLLCVHASFRSNASILNVDSAENIFTINEEQVPLENIATKGEELPSSVDVSKSKYFPPIINQGSVNCKLCNFVQIANGQISIIFLQYKKRKKP